MKKKENKKKKTRKSLSKVDSLDSWDYSQSLSVTGKSKVSRSSIGKEKKFKTSKKQKYTKSNFKRNNTRNESKLF